MRSVSPVTSPRPLYLSLALAGLLCLASPPSPAHAISVGVRAAGSGDPGSPVEVQVYLTEGNGLVAGVQTLIAWDSSCLSPVRGTGTSGNPAECSANTAIPKTLSTNIKSPSNMMALFLSVSDVEPIKQDTWLFTCVFTIDAATTATQCPITLPTVILSDSKGGRLPVTPINGVVRINQANAGNAGGAPSVGQAPVIAPAGVQAGSVGSAATGAVTGGVAGMPGGAAGAASGAAAGAAAGAGMGGAAGAARTGVGLIAPGQPAAEAPAAEGAAGAAAGAAPMAGSAPGGLTPSPARTVAAATTPSPPASTPAVAGNTPSPRGTAPRGTPTAKTATPGTPQPTPKSGGQ